MTRFSLTQKSFLVKPLPIFFFCVTGLVTNCRTTEPQYKAPPSHSPTSKNTSIKPTGTIAAPIPFKDLGMSRTGDVTSDLSDEEIAVATDAYIALLKGTKYFETLDERIHGWPESDSSKPPFGIWWIGVQLERRNGKAVYRHHEIGSDNAAADTGSIYENLCYAHRLFGPGQPTKTLKRTARGLAALSKGARVAGSPNNGIIMSRSFYPESVISHDLPTEVYFDYSRARPGKDNSATEYAHIKNNPDWGDVWIKNKRSKDDMGHVMRSLSQVHMTCDDALDPETKSAAEDARNTHMLWAQRVINDGGAIATLDKTLKVYWPWETLARFVSFGGIECTAYLSLNLFSSGGTGDYDCGDGTSGIIDWVASINDQNLPLVESYHLAALSSALSFNKLTLARKLAGGIGKRMDNMYSVVKSNSWSKSYPSETLSALLTHANAMGVPLKNSEARWLHQQIIRARDSYTTATTDHLYNFLSKAEADGIYPYTPWGSGFTWRDIGAVMGSCSSIWRAQSGAKIIDCEKLQNAFIN